MHIHARRITSLNTDQYVCMHERAREVTILFLIFPFWCRDSGPYFFFSHRAFMLDSRATSIELVAVIRLDIVIYNGQCPRECWEKF